MCVDHASRQNGSIWMIMACDVNVLQISSLLVGNSAYCYKTTNISMFSQNDQRRRSLDSHGVLL